MERVQQLAGIALVLLGYFIILWFYIRIREISDSVNKIEEGVRTVEKMTVKCLEAVQIEIEQLQSELERINEKAGGDGK